MFFALFGEGVCAAAIAARVGLLRAVEAGVAFAGFLTGEVAQAVVFAFGVIGGTVVECYGGC